MKTALILILCVIGYLFMGMVTWGITCLYSRLVEKDNADDVYKDNEFVMACLSLWVIILPFILGFILFRNYKKWVIAIVETIVAKRGEK